MVVAEKSRFHRNNRNYRCYWYYWSTWYIGDHGSPSVVIAYTGAAAVTGQTRDLAGIAAGGDP